VTDLRWPLVGITATRRLPGTPKAARPAWTAPATLAVGRLALTTANACGTRAGTEARVATLTRRTRSPARPARTARTRRPSSASSSSSPTGRSSALSPPRAIRPDRTALPRETAQIRSQKTPSTHFSGAYHDSIVDLPTTSGEPRGAAGRLTPGWSERALARHERARTPDACEQNTMRASRAGRALRGVPRARPAARDGELARCRGRT